MIFARNTVQVDTTKYVTFGINDSEWKKVTCYLIAKAGGGTEKLGLVMTIFARQPGTFYVDQLEIRKATALDLDQSIFAVKSRNKVSQAAELSLYSTGDKVVYFLAAQYDDTTLKSAKLSNVTLTNAASQTVVLPGIGENDKIFVWDGSLKPLNTSLSLSDF